MEMDSCSIPLEAAMEMSLDDYIMAKKQLNADNHNTDTDNYIQFAAGKEHVKAVCNQWREQPIADDPNRPSDMPPLVRIDEAYPKPTTALYRANASMQNGGTAKDIEIQFDNLEYGQAKSKAWRKKNRRNPGMQTRGVDQQTNFKNRVSVHQRLYNMGRQGQGQQPNHINLRVPISVFSNQQPNHLVNRQQQSLVSTGGNNLRSNHTNNNNGQNSLLLNEDFVKSCLEMVPLFTAHLMKTAPKPEPKYDKKLQEEICEIQGKPLMYTGQDFTVVSFDGPGMNVQPKPHTTDISLNQRFA